MYPGRCCYCTTSLTVPLRLPPSKYLSRRRSVELFPFSLQGCDLRGSGYHAQGEDG